MKMYISGKITGLDINEAQRLFQEAEDYLIKQGHEPVNPFKVFPFEQSANHTWKQCLLADIEALFECQGIYMLANWVDSRGARIEKAIAHELELELYFQRILV